jgi:hypothetical protein
VGILAQSLALLSDAARMGTGWADPAAALLIAGVAGR